MHRRRHAVRLALLVCTVALASCGSSSPKLSVGTAASTTARSVQNVTLVLDWTPNTNHSGIYLAKANGLYAAAGLDVTIIEPGEAGGLGQLAAGNAQFAITAAESLLPAVAQGTDIVSVAAIIQHNTSLLIVPTDRGVASPKDLAGKTYGGFGGPLEKALVEKIVSCDGGDASKVKYVEVGNVDYKIGLQRKDYDAAWVFEGWDVIRLRDLEGVALTTIAFHPSCVPDWYTPLIATTHKLIDDQPALVRSFMAATAKGYELARSDAPGAATALLLAAPELDKTLVMKSAAYLASRYADAGQPWGRQDAKVWADFAAFLQDAALLDRPVDTAKVFTNDFLPPS